MTSNTNRFRWVSVEYALIAAVLWSLSALVAAPPTEVFVIGSLYRQHESVAGYSLDTLRRIVVTIDPQVLVLDCTPKEIATQSVHASKIEYPGVIFPLMNERKPRVYAAEPDEPLFSEIVQSIVTATRDLEQSKPETAQALVQLKKASDAALAVYWQTAAHVHDNVTAQALAGREVLNNRIIGPAAETGSRRWNQHWTDAIVRAAKENPGKRILAVAGIQNRSWIMSALKDVDDIDLIDIEKWLRERNIVD